MDPRKPLRPAILIGLALAGCAAVTFSRVAITGTLRVDEVDWGAAPWAVLLVFYGCFAAAAAWHFLAAESAPAAVPLARLVAGAVFIHVLAALAMPHTSNDLFSNLAYGRMSRLGLNPYLVGPRALGEADPFAQMVGQRWIDTPSVYGPILGAVNAVAGLADTVWGALVVFKLELLAASLGTALVAWGFCRAHHAGRDATAAFVLVGWNPLLAWEVSAQSHNDGVMVLAVALFVWAAVAGREWAAIVAIAAAFYIKFAVAPVMGLYLAYVWRRDKLRAVAMAAMVGALGVALFAPHWVGSATLRAPLAAASGDPSRVTRSFAALLSWICWPLPPIAWKAVYKVWWALGTALLGWTGLVGLRRARTVENVLADSLLFLLYYDLLCTPWFHPWYITWTLPLSMALDARWRRLVAIYSAVSVTQYAFPIEPVSTCIIDAALLVLLHRLLGAESFVHLARRAWRTSNALLRRNVAWLAWGAVVLVAANSFAGHDERRAFDEAFADKAAWRWTPSSFARRVRTFGTDDGDVRRYFAYARAALGRPYSAHYVRPVADWLAAFATGGGADPDHSPTVTPPRRLVPYRDFLVEYPAGFFLWTVPPALAAADAEAYKLYFSLFMGLLATAALAIARRLSGEPRLVWWATAAVAALGVITVRRYDVVVSLCACAAVWACRARRPLVAGGALGLAVASKGVPVLIAPVMAMYLWRRGDRRELARAGAAFAAASSLLLAPALLGAGGGLVDALRYHAARPLQIESTGGALASLLARPSVRVVESYGSINVIGGPAGALTLASTLATVALLAWLYVATWCRLAAADEPARRDAILVSSTVASLAAFMVSAKVFSPQYLVWLMPLGLVAALARRGAARWLLLGALLATQVIYPGYYDEVHALVPWASALVLARNLAVGAFALAILRA